MSDIQTCVWNLNIGWASGQGMLEETRWSRVLVWEMPSCANASRLEGPQRYTPFDNMTGRCK